MRVLFVFAFILGFNFANAQLFEKDRVINKENFDKKKWSWGYFLGLNSYDFKINYIENQPPVSEYINDNPEIGFNPNTDDEPDIKVDKGLSFNIGLIGNLRINNYLDLRLEPGVIFTSRVLDFPYFTDENDRIREVGASYIHIPLLLKFSAKRINNFKPFVIGGASVSHNLSNNQNNPNDNSGGEFRMKKNNYYFEVGFGVDFYLEFFKFTPSIRGVFGMGDELFRDDDPNSLWTSNIESLKTRGLFINFTFQ